MDLSEPTNFNFYSEYPYRQYNHKLQRKTRYGNAFLQRNTIFDCFSFFSTPDISNGCSVPRKSRKNIPVTEKKENIVHISQEFDIIISESSGDSSEGVNLGEVFGILSAGLLVLSLCLWWLWRTRRRNGGGGGGAGVGGGGGGYVHLGGGGGGVGGGAPGNGDGGQMPMDNYGHGHGQGIVVDSYGRREREEDEKKSESGDGMVQNPLERRRRSEGGENEHVVGGHVHGVVDSYGMAGDEFENGEEKEGGDLLGMRSGGSENVPPLTSALISPDGEERGN